MKLLSLLPSPNMKLCQERVPISLRPSSWRTSVHSKAHRERLVQAPHFAARVRLPKVKHLTLAETNY